MPKNKSLIDRYSLVILGLLLLVALALRVYKLNTPLADWHSFRQADTASVTREYVKNGIDLLKPQYHDLSNIQSGQDNLEGYRMVEFPLINAATALLFGITQPLHSLPLHVFSRLISVLFSLVSILLLYAVTSKLSGKRVGLLSAAVFTFLPFSIFYSRTILPEIPLITFGLLSTYLFQRYLSEQSLFTLVAFTLSAAITLLIKPTGIFFLLPLIALLLEEDKITSLISPKWILSAIGAAAPLLLWRYWIQNFPSGVPDTNWVLNQDNIRFTGAFFRWLFAERLAALILGYWGLVLFALGFLKRVKTWFYAASFASMLLYLVIFAAGNVRHDYYQIILLPIISIFAALGIEFVLSLEKPTLKEKLLHYGLITVSSLFALAFSWYQIRGYYNINHWEIVRAGQAVDRLAPKDAKVIAPYMGDTAFLYQTNRRGWPIGFEIEDKIEQGATIYVSVNYDDEARELEEIYQTIEKTDEYIILDLGKKRPETRD